MKILFINPPMSHEDLYGEWDVSDVKSSSPPIGVLSIAAIAREKGHDVHFTDCMALGYTLDMIIKELGEYSPDLVCITSMTVSINSTAAVAKMIKRHHPALPIILGGVHISALPERTMRDIPQIDIGVLGEGEATFVELLEHMAGTRELGQIDGIIYRNGDGTLAQTSPRGFIRDLDTLPFPAWDLTDISERYRLSAYGTTADRSAGLITSRGCPGKCIFCDRTSFGRRFRAHSAKYVVDQIEQLYTQKSVTDFLFYDDLFVANRRRLIEICNLLKERNLKISWSCCSRVDYISDKTLGLMKESGCWLIEFGIESGSQKILDFLQKNITKQQVKDAIALTRAAGIKTKGNFIFGNPLETRETLDETIDFAIEIGIDYFQHTFMSPLPGSDLYDIAAEYGEFDPDWKKMNTFMINFIPTGLTREDLIKYSKKSWRKFYLRPSIILNELRKIHNVESMKRVLRGANAFLNSAFRRK
jgi:radical SAM superfamily enzyme YgiQ (UPF0313 family)